MSGVDCPRVLEIEEIAAHDGAVFIEYRDRARYGEEWALYYCEHPGQGMQFVTTHAGKLFLPLEDYGVEWRCWTRRPTPRLRNQKWRKEARG